MTENDYSATVAINLRRMQLIDQIFKKLATLRSKYYSPHLDHSAEHLRLALLELGAVNTHIAEISKKDKS